jgi:hypothetical protein
MGPKKKEKLLRHPPPLSPNQTERGKRRDPLRRISTSLPFPPMPKNAVPISLDKSSFEEILFYMDNLSRLNKRYIQGVQDVKSKV